MRVQLEEAASTVVLERLRSLFTPRSVALVGATDNSQWSVFTYTNLRRYSPEVAVHLVHPRRGTVHGQPAHRSVYDIAEPADLAYVMVPTSAVLGVVEEIADAGTKNLVILTSGFAEAGPDGEALAARLEALASERGLTVLGPNGNGFINVAGGIAPYGLPITPPLVKGPAGIVLQSGGLASTVLSGAQARGVGLSLMVSTGNEAFISATDIMRYLVHDDHTRVIAAFLESVRDPEAFREVAEIALQMGKPIVALKVGRSEQGARTALAHTGAIAGDDRIIDAAFRQLGVVRVDSLEEMLSTTGYLGYHSDVKGRRIAAVTPSGGACDLLADKAAGEGLELPEFPQEALDELADLLPPFSNPRNPLDVTGYVVVDPRLSLHALEIVARRVVGLYDMILYSTSLPRTEPRELKPLVDRLDALSEAIKQIAVPVLLQTSVVSDLPAYAQQLFEERGLYLLNGIELGVRAIGHGARYHDRRDRCLDKGPKQTMGPVVTQPSGKAPPDAAGIWAEHQVRALLEAHGIPMAPAQLATGATKAAEIGAAYACPLAMKIAAAGLLHRSDVGGVRLDVDPRDAAATFEELMRTTTSAEGVLIGPMRTGGIELLVGVIRDPRWGKVLSLGLGGVWVEVLGDVSLRLLPVGQDDVTEMLDELKAAPLLKGARGTRPADVRHLAEVIVRVAQLAEALPLETIEINPFRVDGSQIEALDALVVWDKDQDKDQHKENDL